MLELGSTCVKIRCTRPANGCCQPQPASAAHGRAWEAVALTVSTVSRRRLGGRVVGGLGERVAAEAERAGGLRVLIVLDDIERDDGLAGPAGRLEVTRHRRSASAVAAAGLRPPARGAAVDLAY